MKEIYKEILEMIKENPLISRQELLVMIGKKKWVLNQAITYLHEQDLVESRLPRNMLLDMREVRYMAK